MPVGLTAVTCVLAEDADGKTDAFQVRNELVDERGIPGGTFDRMGKEKLLGLILRLCKGPDGPLIENALVGGMLVDEQKSLSGCKENVFVVDLPDRAEAAFILAQRYAPAAYSSLCRWRYGLPDVARWSERQRSGPSGN